MVAIPLASKSDPARSELVSGERLINCFAEKAPEGSPVPFAVYRSPGLTPFYTGSVLQSRGVFPLINVGGADTLLSLHGNSLISLDSSGAQNILGSVFGAGTVFFARNMKETPQVAIVVPHEGAYLLESGTVSQISDPDLFEDVNSVGFLNGYFLFGEDGGKFQGTSINEGSEISQLDFGVADGHPDGLVRLYVFAQQVLLFGSESTEVWVYDDRETFPFRRMPGAVITIGLAHAEAIAEVSGRLYWVDNTGIVRRLDGGYTPMRVSNVGVEEDIKAALEAGDPLHAWGYLDGGHEFVKIGSPNFSWVFDNVLGVWHNRKTNRYDRWQARRYAHCFGKHLVASDISGSIYELRNDVYDEDGDDLIWEVVTPIVSGFPNGSSINELNLHVETGLGLGASGAPEDQDPMLMMSTTKDGYRTWTPERQRSLGKQGEYRKTIRFNRLGLVGRQGVAFRFKASAAVATAIIQADAEGEPRAA